MSDKTKTKAQLLEIVYGVEQGNPQKPLARKV
jgi:hypothetical protein